MIVNKQYTIEWRSKDLWYDEWIEAHEDSFASIAGALNKIQVFKRLDKLDHIVAKYRIIEHKETREIVKTNI